MLVNAKASESSLDHFVVFTWEMYHASVSILGRDD